MNVKLLKVFLFFLIPVFSFCQGKEDGIYLEIEGKRCSYKKVRSLNRETQVCVSDKPFITINDFQEISPLEVDKIKGIRKFSIKLSKEGTKKLTSISKIYLGKNLAFIVNNRVVCLMEVYGVITSGQVMVIEDLTDSSLKRVYKKIKHTITS